MTATQPTTILNAVGLAPMIVTTQNIDDLAGKIRAAGVPLHGDPADMPWGRSIDATDPDGFKVTISREK